ncbi:MAG: polymerase subunit epsilon [Blastocatellia bacterium]|jgi:DNA polymerase III epsilon subunit-like protein|nr:polymerase subunit epsilon [Blastocatellia bacterium]
MHFNTKQLYTPALEVYELTERALILDTETVGAGPTIEIIEIAIGETTGRIVYETLVQPVFNALPPPSKHHRFDKSELRSAPQWTDIWPALSTLIENRLLVAYNAAFDRRALAATCSRYHHITREWGWRCAMQLAKKLTGAKRSLTLEDACAHFGLAGGNHRAARDVQATCELLKALSAAQAEADK